MREEGVMSLDEERSENMGRPKGSVSIYDDGPRSARCRRAGSAP